MSAVMQISYDRAQKAKDLQDNPLLMDILNELQSNILTRFASADAALLPGMQAEYKAIEAFKQNITNSITGVVNVE